MNKMPQQNVALVAGASGIVGRQLVKTLLHNKWQVIGLSRNAVTHPDAIPMVNVDLLDAQNSAEVLQPLSDITHIFYSAWANAANWTDMVEPNVTMLRHLVSHIEKTAPLQTVSLMQGYKVYGAHLGPFTKPRHAKAILAYRVQNLTPLSSRGSAIFSMGKAGTGMPSDRAWWEVPCPATR